MTEPGRNDPCWCGSGKKFKKCHYLIKEFSNPTNEPPFWMQLRVLEGELQTAIKDYHKAERGGDVILAAQKAFGVAKDAFTEEEQENLICNWAMSPWSPDPDTGQTLSKMYLEDHRGELHPLAVQVIEALNERPFSFIQIREVDPGVSMLVRDLITGEEWRVSEKGGSIVESMGRILYARVVTLDGTSIMMGCAPYPFDPLYVSDIQRLRKHIKPKGTIGIPDLFAHEDTIRNVYLQLRHQHLNPKKPTLVNTDGDLLEPVTLYWELTGPLEPAIEALGPLTLDVVPVELKKDKGGAVKSAEVIWSKLGNKTNKSWDNTMLGRLVLEPGKLMAEVNSRKRAARLKLKVAKCLGDSVLFQKEVIENIDAKLKERPKSSPKSQPARDPEEGKAAMAAFAKKHFENFLDEPIPVLGGLTPKQAVRTKEGKELVEALLLRFVQTNKKEGAVPLDVEEIRRRLKLPKG
jgi:hypothetical protein